MRSRFVNQMRKREASQPLVIVMSGKLCAFRSTRNPNRICEFVRGCLEFKAKLDTDVL